jgi:hypothetical protein
MPLKRPEGAQNPNHMTDHSRVTKLVRGGKRTAHRDASVIERHVGGRALGQLPIQARDLRLDLQQSGTGFIRSSGANVRTRQPVSRSLGSLLRAEALMTLPSNQRTWCVRA